VVLKAVKTFPRFDRSKTVAVDLLQMGLAFLG
jgi:hypothetical protein